MEKEKPTVTLAGGCFWCIEAEFRRLSGVTDVMCGYEGGHTDNPTYEQVCTGKTGHAEVVCVIYDPAIIARAELFDHFLTRAHDPTDLNGQGVDRGTQYRSAIFYKDEDERREAMAAIARTEKSGPWKKPIVTTLEQQTVFWPAEEYHQNYYTRYAERNGAPHIRHLYKMRKWESQ